MDAGLPTNRRMAAGALVVLLALGFASSAQADPQTWRVQPGEALSVIAARFAVSVDDLRAWNTLEGDRILPGQELVVTSPEPTGPTHTVQRGETLSHIAVLHQSTVEHLLELNPEVEPERLRAGVMLRVESLEDRHAIDYVVRRGDNLSRIASRHRVDVRDIRRWNPGLDGDRLLVGSSIRVFSDVPASVSESLGKPHRGRLANAEQLPPHPGYFVRDARRSYGTLETILWIQDGVDAVLDAHEGTPRIRIHDISQRDGGRMRDHRSHQSGRDVDMSFYQQRCADRLCPSRRIRPEELDAERQWTLFAAWLREGRVDAIFIDHSLQQPLYEEARRQGASRAELSRWFQYPRSRFDRQGVIRHYPRHRDHAHVRFICPDTDENCR